MTTHAERPLVDRVSEGLRPSMKKGTLAFLLSVPLLMAIYLLVAQPALEGELNFKFYSDSLVYEDAWDILRSREVFWGESVGLLYNYLGPFVVLSLTGGSRTAVFLVNILVFFVGFRLLVKTERVPSLPLFALLALNPILLASLFSVNKEIMLFGGFAMLIAYWRGRGRRYFVAALLFAVLVRWQFALFVILVALVKQLRPLKSPQRQMVILTAVLLALSLVYQQLYFVFEILHVRQTLMGAESGDGIYLRLSALQERGLYFLVFLPKALQLLVGEAFAGEPFSLAGESFFNNAIRHFHSWFNVMVLVSVIGFRKVSWSDPRLFLIILYTVVFVLTPVYEVRYLFPVSVVLSLMLLSDRPASRPVVPPRPAT